MAEFGFQPESSAPPQWDSEAGVRASQEFRREQEEHERRVEGQLEVSAPELLAGRLPSELEERLERAPYALGYHQVLSRSLQTPMQVRDLMEQTGGVGLGTGFPVHRFRIADQTIPRFAHDYAVNGNSGAGIGRLVYTFPISSEEDTQLLREGKRPYQIVSGRFYTGPKGFYQGEDQVIPPRYCAGFIDPNGDFWPNAGFMREDEFVVDSF